MTLRDDVEFGIRDGMAGYLAGMDQITSGPAGRPTQVNWPTNLSLKQARQMNPEKRSLITLAWVAAIHDEVLKLADRLDKERRLPASNTVAREE